MITGVYQITCKANGRRYVGSSCDIESRWKEHQCELDQKKHHNEHLQNAWNKYGVDLFRFEVLEECELGQEKIREQHYLDDLEPEFNIHLDACGFSKGQPSPMTGRKHTHATRKRMSASAMGRKRTAQTLAKLSIAAMGNQRATGHVCTIEAKRKMSAAWTLERRAKISTLQRGKTLAFETRVKISAALKGRVPWNKGMTKDDCSKIAAYAEMMKGNQRGKGHKLTLAHKAKLSAMMKGNQRFKDKSHTPGTITKMQESWTPERRAAQSERTRLMNEERKAKATANTDG